MIQQYFKKPVLLLYLLCVIFLCKHSLNARQFNRPTDTSINVLFIGNSLTYVNNLPFLVSELAKQKGIHVTTTMLAYPNYALEDHWNDKKIELQLISTKYDFVVIQQGPSSQADGREMLARYGLKFKLLCDRYRAKLVFFMVWPSFQNFQTFDGVIKNYTDAAAVSNAIICPVGAVWKDYFLKTKDYSYYGPDQFHPSKKGSEIAAELILDTLITNFNH